MSAIKIKIVDHAILLSDSPFISSGSRNVDSVEFSFDDTWTGFEKIAVFFQQKGEFYYSLIDENSQAIIPREALFSSKPMNLGVIGVKGNQTKTSAMLRYQINNGAIDGVGVVDPDPDIYEQLLNKYTEIKNLFATMSEQQTQFIEDEIAAREQFETKINQQQTAFIEAQNADREAYQAEWKENVTDSILEAEDATREVYDALASLQLESFDMNGGDPFTESSSDDFDVNGGYPVAMGG